MRKTKAKKMTSKPYAFNVRFATRDVDGVRRGVVQLGIAYGDDPKGSESEVFVMDMDAETAWIMADKLVAAAKQMERWLSTN